MGHILVADDDPDIRWLVGETLEGAGYRVREAGDGREALRLALLPEDRPCLILLDLRMPVMDGPTFAQAYRQVAGSDVPIICMTAETDAPRRGAAIGAAATLSKPFDLDEVARLVRHFCPG